jgi:hypothetical protein
VVVGSGVRGDEEAAGESGEGLEHGVQRVWARRWHRGRMGQTAGEP